MKPVWKDSLKEYCGRDYYPWHMPGHKRQTDIHGHVFDDVIHASYDVTEVDGLDNLHIPEKSIAQSMAQLSKIYGSKASYYLVNGSTSGILTAISAVCDQGDTILMGRHCHKSVYHAVALLGLQPVYLYPGMIKSYGICGSITPEQIREAIKQHPDAKGIIFPSPTYEGVLSDIMSIAHLAHEAGMKLIVDEAHGANLEFGDGVPKPAIRCGADLVVESLHKTLPCYTQCAILHVGDSELTERTERYLKVYQTSSPSYLFVANMEDAIVTMDAWRTGYVAEYYQCLRRYRESWKQLNNIHLLSPEEVLETGNFAYDETKLVFVLKKDGMNGQEFMRQMEERHGMILEMASAEYVLAMTSIADTEAAFSRLHTALQDMDRRLENGNVRDEKVYNLISGKMEITPAEAWKRQTEKIPLEEAADRIAADFVTVYPPAIPILVPGEIICRKQIAYILQGFATGQHIEGMTAKDRGKDSEYYITVLKNA